MTKVYSSAFLSIILPTYNGEKYLVECIEGVLSQTFKNFILVIVDDGSKDNTLEIINSYKKKDRRIKFLAGNRFGPVGILNYAISNIDSKWIARVDQDDIWLPEKLENQIRAIKLNNKICLIGTGFLEINEFGHTISKHLFPRSNFWLKFNLTRLKGFFPHSSSLFKLSAVKKIGGYNLNLYMADDWAMWSSMVPMGEFYCVNKALVKVRRHPQQRSFVKDGGRLQIIHAIASITLYFIKKYYRVNFNNNEWKVFISWIESELDGENYLDDRNKVNFLKGYLKKSKITLKQKIMLILHSCNQINLLKFFFTRFTGSNFPRNLALKWLKMNNQRRLP